MVNDVTDGSALAAAVAAAVSRFGPVDFACANAGVAIGTGLDRTGRVWQKCWDVNVLGVVNLARAVLPDMASREGGAFLVTASAAGLLTSLDSAPYAVTKHAAVALAEWLAITYAGAGVAAPLPLPAGRAHPHDRDGGGGAVDARRGRAPRTRGGGRLGRQGPAVRDSSWFSRTRRSPGSSRSEQPTGTTGSPAWPAGATGSSVARPQPHQQPG